MNLTDNQKFEILKIAYKKRRKEIAFPRERSLKVTSWMVGVFLAFSAVLHGHGSLHRCHLD